MIAAIVTLFIYFYQCLGSMLLSMSCLVFTHGFSSLIASANGSVYLPICMPVFSLSFLVH